jgi:hypothetical protein
MGQILEEFCITTFKRLDSIKGQLKVRYVELEGHEPSSEELAWRCFYFWNLTTHHLSARRFWNADTEPDTDHASYIPPELVGERSERIQAMDARLQEVLGDAVDADDDDDSEDEDESFDFQPGADEQIYMVEYGSIILEHRDFVEDMNTVQFWDGADGWLLNIVHKNIYGFDSLMSLLWETLQTRLHAAQ